jgi:hypothetical protein
MEVKLLLLSEERLETKVIGLGGEEEEKDEEVVKEEKDDEEEKEEEEEGESTADVEEAADKTISQRLLLK